MRYPVSTVKGALSREKMRGLLKFLSHEHLDCSLRPETVLEIASGLGFENFKSAPFPSHAVQLWQQSGARSKAKAAAAYQRDISSRARNKLSNYIGVIVGQLLPVMQTAKNLYRVTNERIKDAVDENVICMNLRFAPQLHMQNGLTMDQAVEAVIGAVEESPIPVTLTLCCLRHEDEEMHRQVADVAIRHKYHVRKFDLAGDEQANPGVRTRWMNQAARVSEHGIEPTIHIAETNALTREDIRRLKAIGVEEIDHGFRDDLYTGFTRTICVTSNVVTGNTKSFGKHNVDQLYRDGRPLTICTDGTLMTMTDLTNEYMGLQYYFGWGMEHFYRVNMTALRLASLPRYVKDTLANALANCYLPENKRARHHQQSGGSCAHC